MPVPPETARLPHLSLIAELCRKEETENALNLDKDLHRRPEPRRPSASPTHAEPADPLILPLPLPSSAHRALSSLFPLRGWNNTGAMSS